jgi:hypothetical protein
MTTEQWSVAVSGIGVFLSALFSYVIAILVSRRTREEWLKSQVDKYIDFAIAHPYLDSDKYASTWRRNDESEAAERYQNFCCFAFNLLERIWTQCDGDAKKIDAYIYYGEVVKRHRNWWITEPHNQLGYEPAFIEFIRTVLQEKAK